MGFLVSSICWIRKRICSTLYGCVALLDVPVIRSRLEFRGLSVIKYLIQNDFNFDFRCFGRVHAVEQALNFIGSDIFNRQTFKGRNQIAGQRSSGANTWLSKFPAARNSFAVPRWKRNILRRQSWSAFPANGSLLQKEIGLRPIC